MARLINCILLVFSLSMDSVRGEIVKGPLNALTFVGGQTILRCCFRDRSPDSTWTKYLDNGLKHKICGSRICPHNRNYKINTTVPECNNLLIVSSSKNDSTLYECSDGTGSKAAGYVATYKCSTNVSNEDDIVEGDIVAFLCHIMSHSKPKFHTYWKYENRTIANGIHSYENQNQYVSVLTVTAQHPELLPYTWNLKFLISSDGEERIDMSTPTANWTSKRTKVAYPVIKIRTDCIDGACERVLGDSIRCDADGYPIPHFSWLNEDGVEICSGPMLKLNLPETQKYTCVAKNSIRGILYTESIVTKVFIRVTERYYDSDTTRHILYVLMLLLVLIGLYKSKAKVVGACCKIKRQFTRKCFSDSITNPEGEHLRKTEEEVKKSNSARDDDDDKRLEMIELENIRKGKKRGPWPDPDDEYTSITQVDDQDTEAVDISGIATEGACGAVGPTPYLYRDSGPVARFVENQ